MVKNDKVTLGIYAVLVMLCVCFVSINTDCECIVLAFALGLSTLNGLRLHPEKLEFVLSML